MRRYKIRFNQLLLQFQQCRRKLANLRFNHKNLRRQHLLEKRLVRLYEKLMGLRKAIGMGMAATAVVGLSLVSSQTAQAQSFAGPQLNPFGLTYQPDSSVTIPTFADLDGDGDMDMLSGSGYGNFYYYKNTGTATNPTFAAPVKNPFGLDSIPNGDFDYPTFVDLDGDGDMDLLVGSYYGKFYYYENTGTPTNPTFAAPVVDPFGLTAPPTTYTALPSIVDMDGDGDMDIMAPGSDYGYALYYYQNTGTANAPAFATPEVNPFGLVPPDSIFSFLAFGDLDNDGDPDLLTGSYYASFHYYENTGTPNTPTFGSPVTNPFGLTGLPHAYVALPTFVDLDGDGDLDIVAGSAYGYFTFYKNTTPTGIKATKEPAYAIFPNPVENVLHISGAQGLNLVSVYSMDGRLLGKIKTDGNTSDASIDFANYPKGTYLVKLRFKDGAVSSKLITK